MEYSTSAVCSAVYTTLHTVYTAGILKGVISIIVKHRRITVWDTIPSALQYGSTSAVCITVWASVPIVVCTAVRDIILVWCAL